MALILEDRLDLVACVDSPERDCATAGALIATLVDGLIPPYKLVYEFYNNASCIPSDGNYSWGQIIDIYRDWRRYGGGADPTTISYLTNLVGTKCREDFCRNLQFAGNPDFAGIGVLVAFVIQLSIATLFCNLYAYSLYKGILAVPKPQKKILNVFIMTCVYFNIGLAIAVPITMAATGNSEYTARISSLGFLIALASTVALWPFYEKCNMDVLSAYSSWMKRFAGIGTLLTSSMLLAMFAYSIPQHVGWDKKFELYYFHSLDARPFAETFPYVPMVLVALGLLVVLLKYILPKRLVDPFSERLEKWLLPLTSALGFLLMWAAFAVLLRLRQEMGAITGASYQEADWGFGQVLAVVAWLPTLVQAIWQLLGKRGGREPAACRDDQED